MVQSKPILIDAVHITMGGGKSLLDYLCEKLVARHVSLIAGGIFAKHNTELKSSLCFA